MTFKLNFPLLLDCQLKQDLRGALMHQSIQTIEADGFALTLINYEDLVTNKRASGRCDEIIV